MQETVPKYVGVPLRGVLRESFSSQTGRWRVGGRRRTFRAAAASPEGGEGERGEGSASRGGRETG